MAMIKVTYKDLTNDEEALKSMPTSVGTFHRFGLSRQEFQTDDPMLPAILTIEAWLRAQAELRAAEDQPPLGEE
jgi:hypothetical protein